jgi:hypothetical protein
MPNVQHRGYSLPLRESLWADLIRKEDWLAVWIGLGLIAIAIAKFASGGSIQWVAVAPQKWSGTADLAVQLRPQGLRYLAVGLLWVVLFGTGATALGLKFSRFLMAFIPLFIVAAAIYILGLWDQAAHYNLEPPLVALALDSWCRIPSEHRAGSTLRCGWSSTSRRASCSWVRACRSHCLPGRARSPSFKRPS